MRVLCFVSDAAPQIAQGADETHARRKGMGAGRLRGPGQQWTMLVKLSRP
jgi:hypothetical protein